MQYFKTTSVRWWLFVIIANVLLTTWMVYAIPTLDYDAILYISAAKAIANDNWQLSTELYRGSLYPYLIYLSQKLSGFSYETSAYLLNALLLSITSYAFIAIVKKLGGKTQSIFYISFVLILFFPGLLKYRPDVFREFGFFACYFWSIYYFLLFTDTQQKKYLFIWFSLLSVGLFFRVFRGSSDSYLMQSALNYPVEYINRALYVLNQKLTVQAEGGMGVLKAIFEPIWSVLYIILKRFEVIYALLIIVSYKAKLVLVEPYKRKVIFYYLFISFVILILFQMSLGYITSRYAMTFVLTGLLLVPFVIEKAIHLISEGKPLQKIGISFLLLILCFLSVKRLVISDRDIEINTGLWITNNIPQESIVASNNSKVLYYAKRFPYLSFKKERKHYRFSTQLMVSPRNHEAFERAEYIALMVRPDNQIDVDNEQKIINLHGQALQRIEQQDSDVYVSIYKVQ